MIHYYGNSDIKLHVQFIGPPMAGATAVVPQPQPPQSHDDLSPFSPLAREKRIVLLRQYPNICPILVY